MKDNYGQTGKTISSQFSLLNQGANPSMPTYQTTAVTTIQTPVVTTSLPTAAITTQPTTVATVVTTTPVPPTATTLPPAPIPTKAPGFEALLAGAALLVGLAACGKKE